MDSQALPLAPLQPNQLHSTSQAAEMLGVVEATLRSRKSRHKELLVEGIHWKHQDGGTFWTTTGILVIAERTSTAEAKALLSQAEKLPDQQLTPLTLVVDNTNKANNIAVIADQPTHKLSAEEAQVFVEAIGEKLPETQVQDLLQQMQNLDTAPARSQRNVRNRLLVAASIVAALILGGSGGWLMRANETSATRSEIVDRNVVSNSAVVGRGSFATQRERAIEQSLTLAIQQQEAIDLLRRDYLLQQAERSRKTTGRSIEQWLIRHLNRQVEALQRSATNNAGSAEQIAIARSIAGETKATLLALQSRKTPSKSYSATATTLKRSLQQITP